MLPDDDARGPSLDALGTTQAQSPPLSSVPGTAATSARRRTPSRAGADEPGRLVPGRLVPVRLSQGAFAPYGSVLRRGDPVWVNDGFATRSDALTDLACSDPSARLCLSLFDVGVRPASFAISELERHPYSAQVFLPLSPCRALVVVAGTTQAGDIDLDAMAAFVAAPGDGILYAPGVWHLGLASLDRPGQFQMATWSGDLPDTQIRRLGRPFTIDVSALSVLPLEPDESAPR